MCLTYIIENYKFLFGMSKAAKKKSEENISQGTKSKFQVANVKTSKYHIDQKAVEKFANLIKKHNLHPDPMSLLPNFEQDEVRFTLSGTNSHFANFVRRTLVNEIDCLSLTCTHGSIKTDDLYLTNKTDKIIDDIGTAVCNQELTQEQYKKLEDGILFILKANKTESPINVTVEDVYYMKKDEFKKHFSLSSKAYEELTGFVENGEKKGGADMEFLEKSKINPNNYGSFKIPEHIKLMAYDEGQKSSLKLDFLFPIKNQIISRLTRGKTLFVMDIKLVKGRGFQNAGRFTLLDNVYYEPKDVKPFDMYSKPGPENKRSIEVSPSIFELGFRTRGNISIKRTMQLCCDSMLEALSKMKDEIEMYSKSENKDFYETPEFKVEFSDGIFKYYFKTLYLGAPMAVERECYEIDPTINFITAGNENYEKRVGIIKINHPDSVGLLLKAVGNCINYVKTLSDAF